MSTIAKYPTTRVLSGELYLLTGNKGYGSVSCSQLYFPDAPSQPTASASYVLIGVLVRGPTEHIPVSMLAERIGGSAYSAPGLAVHELDALRPRARFSQPLDLFHTRYSAVRLLTKRRMQKRIVYVTRLAAYPCGSSRTQW